MRIQLDISGSAPELLRQYPERLRRAGVLACKRMAETYVEDIHDWIVAGRAFTPRTGHLEQSISWRPLPNGAEVYAQAGYAGYVERGTKPHVIRPRPGREALRFKGAGGGFVIRRSVRHPGSKPHPFFFTDLPNRTSHLLQTARETFAEVLSGEVR